MPTLFTIFGIRFFFYTHDHEPIHIHIAYGGKLAKIQVLPEVKIIYDKGVGPQVLKKAIRTVKAYKNDIIAEWHKNFDK